MIFLRFAFMSVLAFSLNTTRLGAQTNIVVNGGFLDGANGTNGWTFVTTPTDTGGGAGLSTNPEFGNLGCTVSGSSTIASLSQILPTIPGGLYEISFSYYYNTLFAFQYDTRIDFGLLSQTLDFTNWYLGDHNDPYSTGPQTFDFVTQATVQNSLLDFEFDFTSFASPKTINNVCVQTVLAITQQPLSDSALISSNANFSVATTGVSPIAYQWYFNNTNQQSPAGAIALMAYGFVYAAMVTNGGSGYTSTPNVQFLGGGGNGVTGTAVVSNGMVVAIIVTNAVLGYTNLPMVQIDPPNGLLINQTNATLTVSDISTNDLGCYFVVVTNVYGNVTSSLASLTVALPPSIRQQPKNSNVAIGSNATFSVVLDGTPPFGYQWWKVSAAQSSAAATPVVIGGFVLAANICSSGNGYLTVPQLQIVGGNGSGAGGYAVVSNRMVSAIIITNAGSGYTSPPTIQIDAPSALSMNGQTNALFDLPSVSSDDAANYYVVVTNNFGSVTTDAASLVVFLPPQSFMAFENNSRQLILQFTGSVGYPYVLQSTTNLVPPIDWQPVLTNMADGNGSWSEILTNWQTTPVGFFRVVGR
ncbi:MAG TPA: immunoglobulin domain-containing protein [Verrucomicrobiae bacterium]|nr:immunoglobulin domain-containing protein [Verrucomicrobiae bacterium]